MNNFARLICPKCGSVVCAGKPRSVRCQDRRKNRNRTATQLYGTQRQRGGVAAKNAGKEFERLILASQIDSLGPVCSLIQIGSYAQWVKTSHEEEKATGQRLKTVAKASHFDFAGCIWERGTCVAFDAKSFSEERASFPANDDKLVKKHQIEALSKLERAGAFAGFLVECGRMNDVRWIWAEAVSDAARLGKGIQWSDSRWHVLGPYEYGRIAFRKFFEDYK